MRMCLLAVCVTWRMLLHKWAEAAVFAAALVRLVRFAYAIRTRGEELKACQWWLCVVSPGFLKRRILHGGRLRWLEGISQGYTQPFQTDMSACQTVLSQKIWTMCLCFPADTLTVMPHYSMRWDDVPLLINGNSLINQIEMSRTAQIYQGSGR